MMRRVAVFTVVLIMLGVVRVSAQEIEKVSDELWSTRDIVLSRAAGSVNRITIKSSENLSGKLTLQAWDRDSIVVTYSKQAKTDTRSRAIDYIDLMSVELEIPPQGADLELRAPNPAPWNKRADKGMVFATIQVPNNIQVEIDATYHDVTANGPFASLRIPESLGRLEVSHVHGELDITTANRRVFLQDVSGSVSASTSNSLLRAVSVDGSNGPARFRNEGGDIELDSLRGEINVRNSYGRVMIQSFVPGGESSVIRNVSGLVSVNLVAMTEGQLIITNRHEDIEITIPDDLSAFLSLAVEDGEIDCTGFTFSPELVQDNRLNLIVGDGEVDFSGTVRGEGDIYVRGVPRQ